MENTDMKKPTLNRRQVLRGLGGFTLALPLLPSLLTPSEARAQAAAPPKRFIQFCTDHGGVWGVNMFPPDPSEQTQQYAGRTIRRGPLSLEVQSGRARLSPVLSADSTVLTSGLVAKMNVVRGVDIPFYIAHHTGGHLGNYARNDGNGGDGGYVAQFPRRTIDQVMAWSPSFYPSLSGVRERTLVLGERISYGYSNPQSPSNGSDIQALAATAASSRQLFNKLFPEPPGGGGRLPIVDRVFESYQRLRQSNRRLSTEDRRRLDEHMQRVSELQRRLSTVASCSDVPRPTQDNEPITWDPGFPFQPDSHGRYFQLYNDVIVMALLCGVSRIAVVKVDPTFSTFTGDWHQDIAHRATDPEGGPQATLTAAHQRFFETVMVDLARKLDVDDGTGRTLLDNSLLVWTQESGNRTHDSQSIPIITFGSAGGFLRTGQYVDYRNLTRVFSTDEAERRWPGLTYNQWLGTVLQAMGLQRQEYEASDVAGYGVKYSNVQWTQITTAEAYPEVIWSVAGEVLPWLRP
jgi:hypothetical protein